MVFKYNIYHWVKIYMQRLKDIKSTQLSMKAGRVKDSIRDQIKEKFKASKKRLILLDYNRTLVGFKTQINLASQIGIAHVRTTLIKLQLVYHLLLSKIHI